MSESCFLLCCRLENFSKFTRKYLCQCLVFNKAVGWKKIPQKTQNQMRQGSLRNVAKGDRFCSKIYSWSKRFCLKNLLFWSTADFTFYSLYFEKNLQVVFFLSTMPERKDSTIFENLKPTDLIHRILKSQKTISLTKIYWQSNSN